MASKLERACMVAACKIQQGESRRVCTASRVFAAIAGINVPRESVALFLLAGLLFAIPLANSSPATTSTITSFVTTLPTLLLAHLISSISHYPANSLPTRLSQKSSCALFSLARRNAIDIRSSRILFEPSGPISSLLSSPFFHFRSNYIKCFPTIYYSKDHISFRVG